jgi:hypothetical protein
MNPRSGDASAWQFAGAEFVRSKAVVFFVFIFLLKIGLSKFKAAVTPRAALPLIWLFLCAGGADLDLQDRVEPLSQRRFSPWALFSRAEDTLKRRMT